ncbi:Lipase/lipooxygenase, putative isoform 3 [Theobroma cacao]|uniref:Lipase/lipooxygenase, putative isoform 3 n=1 Tax=Theobroma cacao TaxID=3641 RepID=A0A061GS37_THECC|nr:Lipase/lipooxygenase, putative isoform 3 [Theobroma cacao]
MVLTLAMESVSVSHTIFATNQRNPVRISPPIHVGRKFHFRAARCRFGFLSCSKKSDFQDFQGFAKPSRLLPSTELKVCTETLGENFFSSTSLNGARSFYKVRLQTSRMYGSSLSNINAGILLCLIDEKGDSILQRIPAYLLIEDPAKLENVTEPETLYFQRGSVDEFVFEGPNLGKVEALWISLESGQWRLGGVSLIILNASQPSFEEDYGENVEFIGSKYNFKVDEILLGEGGDESMVELRPCLVTELSGPNLFKMFSKGFSQPTLPLSDQISNEKSMKEYADLKFSLLLYDAVLIFVGTSFASFSIGESSALAFLLGGISGFLYLLLLQRSVDGLSASELISKNPGDQMVRFRSPLSILALAVALSLLAVKYGVGDTPFVLTPKELLVGMIGFLVCKVAVVLAAFKPLPVSIEERE